MLDIESIKKLQLELSSLLGVSGYEEDVRNFIVNEIAQYSGPQKGVLCADEKSAGAHIHLRPDSARLRPYRELQDFRVPGHA